jgi:hypothetical protein
VKRIIADEEFCQTFMAGMALCVVDSAGQRTICWGERFRDASEDPEQIRSLMLAARTGYLAEIARELDLSHRSDYGMIKAVFCEKDDAQGTASGTAFAESLCAAVEYELGAVESSAAFSRLTMLHVPLKVLITFPEERSAVRAQLDDCVDILRRKERMEKEPLTAGHVVIFGFTAPRDIRFSYFVYREGRFVSWH